MSRSQQPEPRMCHIILHKLSKICQIVLGTTCREQERRTKVDDARREAERLLRVQQAELEAKKADMARRDAERDAAREAAAVQAGLISAEAKAKVTVSPCCVHQAHAVVSPSSQVANATPRSVLGAMHCKCCGRSSSPRAVPRMLAMRMGKDSYTRL